MQQTILKAIIFDYGNVLCLPPTATDMTKMADIFNMSVQEFRKAYHQFRTPYDRGDIAACEYWTAIAAFASVTLTDTEVKALTQIDCKMWARPRKITISWIQHLRRQGFSIALLSNMPHDLQQYLDEHCLWLHCFDYRTFSSHICCTKPSPEIYYHCLDGLNILPAQALFFDDNADNISGAHNIGLNAILFTSAKEVAANVRSQFAIQLPLHTSVN